MCYDSLRYTFINPINLPHVSDLHQHAHGNVELPARAVIGEDTFTTVDLGDSSGDEAVFPNATSYLTWPFGWQMA